MLSVDLEEVKKRTLQGRRPSQQDIDAYNAFASQVQRVHQILAEIDAIPRDTRPAGELGAMDVSLGSQMRNLPSPPTDRLRFVRNLPSDIERNVVGAAALAGSPALVGAQWGERIGTAARQAKNVGLSPVEAGMAEAGEIAKGVPGTLATMGKEMVGQYARTIRHPVESFQEAPLTTALTALDIVGITALARKPAAMAAREMVKTGNLTASEAVRLLKNQRGFARWNADDLERFINSLDETIEESQQAQRPVGIVPTEVVPSVDQELARHLFSGRTNQRTLRGTPENTVIRQSTSASEAVENLRVHLRFDDFLQDTAELIRQYWREIHPEGPSPNRARYRSEWQRETGRIPLLGELSSQTGITRANIFNIATSTYRPTGQSVGLQEFLRHPTIHRAIGDNAEIKARFTTLFNQIRGMSEAEREEFGQQFLPARTGVATHGEPRYAENIPESTRTVRTPREVSMRLAENMFDLSQIAPTERNSVISPLEYWLANSTSPELAYEPIRELLNSPRIQRSSPNFSPPNNSTIRSVLTDAWNQVHQPPQQTGVRTPIPPRDAQQLGTRILPPQSNYSYTAEDIINISQSNPQRLIDIMVGRILDTYPPDIPFNQRNAIDNNLTRSLIDNISMAPSAEAAITNIRNSIGNTNYQNILQPLEEMIREYWRRTHGHNISRPTPQ